MDDTLVSAEQLDQITDRFKGAWNSGETPKLGKFLTDVSEVRRSHLLSELLPIELTSRRNRGETPVLDTYLSSFPQDAAIVSHCFSVPEPESTFKNRQRLIDTQTQAETDFANDSDSPATSAEISGSTTDSELEAHHPKQLGSFRIIKKIGEGGMGYVFEAKDIQLNRRVALKVMKREVATNASARKRFLREGRAVASLHDDHIIPIFQVGETDDIPFIAMPLLSGETLDNRVSQSGSLSGQELLRVAREIALGLVAAHSNGVIHRDIKPSNLWLEEPYGRIKILDFGLARMDEEDQALTVTGSFIGTPMYMSPEQADGLKLDERSELFSFGAVLYFAATGESPFRRSTLTATLHAIGYAEPAIPHTVNKVIPETFSGLIMWLLSKKADDRPSSAVEVLELVELIVADELSPSSDEPSIDISHTDEPSNDIEEDIEDQVHDPRYDEPLIDIDISSIISTDESLKLAHRAMTTVQDFINEVHYVISSEVAPGTYGRKWLLQDRDTRRVLGSRKRRGYAPKDDLRLLSDAAVFPGTRWEVLKLDLK